ncbi:solute carrier family 35 member F1-like protein isoform X1 [Tanacetum coccineum]|uniref:Solute carrier family 35 member F1-like protein isoform X1 n=1 Tax=Tanacetum coccineum TaxID=301880 RepID=A0ABQ5DFD9_9ASTR
MNSAKYGGGIWRVLYVVLLGQLVSFSMALMSFNASLSANLGVNAPFTLGFCSYLSITLVFGTVFLYRRQKLQISWYWYILLAFVDVQGSFLGLCLVLLSDSGVGGGGGSNPILGDVLVIAGTCFFGLSNVGEEYVVKKVGRVEVLAMFGAFGMLVSIMEMYPLSLKGRSIFERKSLAVAPWNQAVILTFVGFGIAGFMFCSLTPLVLEASGATLFNLSLLTADMWAVVIRVLIYHQKVDWLYYVSFLFVGIGLIIYSKTEKYPSEVSKLENADTERQYKLLPEEAVRE